ncbi:cytochrome c biogenesis protein/redoxin [Kribbella sp. NPDC051587]|uniref:cytochrome c biogenesis protein/redoxin n=1 Tax=Kribbella sp. NPDC051587 TaxID=3364119 RepID=UPI0037B70358
MSTLVLIGLLGGLITGVSPCVLPMLPIVFFAGTGATTPPGDTAGRLLVEGPATGRASSRRPSRIIAGIVVSFSLITLTGTVLLSALGLPDSLLRWAGLVVLTLVGLGLIIPQLGHLLERPFYRLPTISQERDRGGFLLGLGLGTLYVPCAGPVLAAVTVAGATGTVGWNTVVLTLAFAVGAAFPLLVFALAGSRISERLTSYRHRARIFRTIGGIVMIVLALSLSLGATNAVQQAIPSYTSGLEQKIADALRPGGKLAPANGADGAKLDSCTPGAVDLADCGPAPEIRGTQQWFNAPAGRPVTLAGLKGKVVLVDFWTFDCINCERDNPHIGRLYDAYKDQGFEVVGIHTPEYSFERDAGNVAKAVRDKGIAYPVGQDNDYATWNAFRNQYWPAKYLVDATGTVRSINFGEGGYAQLESQIRQLLTDSNPTIKLGEQVEM